jgi:hypothetical protein
LDKIEPKGGEGCERQWDRVKFLGEKSSKEELHPNGPYHIAGISARDLQQF